MMKSVLWDHVTEAQRFTDDRLWWLHHQLLGNVMIFWSTILQTLAVRETLVLEIKYLQVKASLSWSTYLPNLPVKGSIEVKTKPSI